MDDIYATDSLILKQAKLILINDVITVQINNVSVEYQNSYTAFSFDDHNNQLLAPHFKLRVSAGEAKTLKTWLMELFI